jgi:hypothetical protein
LSDDAYVDPSLTAAQTAEAAFSAQYVAPGCNFTTGVMGPPGNMFIVVLEQVAGAGAAASLPDTFNGVHVITQFVCQAEPLTPS